MRKVILIILSFLSINSVLFGQNKLDIAPFDQCGFRIGTEEREVLYPGYKERIDAILKKAAEEGKLNRGDGDLYTINVVVHIVYKKEAENLDDSIILNQIKILNDDFRRTNADANNVRSIYDDIVTDANIEFKLDRIIRVSTTKIFKGNLRSLAGYDKIKKTISGGSDAIDPVHYLNIWVGNLQPPIPGSLLFGYAYPPADLPNWPDGNSAPSPGLEGVVIDYRAFGSNNPNQFPAPFNTLFKIKGRTPTHEVGHYLGLRHIWADKGNLLTGAPKCNGEDDGADDTPFCGNNSQLEGCDTTKNTCRRNQPGDLPDMFENYMDYSREECQNSFTKDQISIMRSVLENERADLIETSTAITNVKYVNELLVFPNPSNGQIIVKAKILPINIQVFDLLGKLVFENNKPLLVNKIDLNTAKGIYFVKTEFSNGIATEKIIVE